MIAFIFNILKSILPYSVHQKLRPIWWLLSGTKPEFPSRNDLVTYDIQDHVKLNVYWKTPVNGNGPALTLSVYDLEVLRFDCFGKGDGHFHIHFGRDFGAQQNRIFLPETTHEAQIDRSFFELRKNLYYYLQRNRDRRIRNVKIDTDNMEHVLVPIHEKMVDDISKAVSVIQDSQPESV